jgi:hypothetical protein
MKAPASLDWPKALSEQAFHGLVGDIVRTIEPHTESDPAALLIQSLVAFGNVIHRGPHWRAEAVRHPLNLFAVLVGETSKARKGTSWGHVCKLVSRADETVWGAYCIQTGLSSGEGLMHAVRDSDPFNGENGSAAGSDDKRRIDSRPFDAGPMDTRLLVMEPEFVSPLRMMSRDGNTLSPVIRQAWDGQKLQVLTKQCPESANNAHISIIGHITRDELMREMARIDMANGFGNRFLWACARRSKMLPDGGYIPEADFDRLATQMKQAVEFANSLGDYEIRRDPEAKALWHSIYANLSEGKHGLFGAVTSRAEAQVMRLACIYALLDRSTEVRKVHLEAALAVWNYCEASARYIFGDALGDPLADTLLSLLRLNPQGLTRTEINNILGRNRKSENIERPLLLLSKLGLARIEIQQTTGRPIERWHAITS